MKYATINLRGTQRVAVIREQEGMAFPLQGDLSMIDIIGLTELPPTEAGIPLNEVQLLAPIPKPTRSIFCVGKNYREHAHEFVRSGFDVGANVDSPIDPDPVIFTKLSSSVTGPSTDVQLHPRATQQVDYEGELAVIIGREGTQIASVDAMDFVWGFTITNDVTARDLQKRHRQWDLGKSLDTFCPMGPWIATVDEVDLATAVLKTHVNGEQRQNCKTSDMIHQIPDLIATISAGITLHPGDIIATGTPVGVGIGLTPAQYLQSGDEVVISISGVGTLRNKFVAD